MDETGLNTPCKHCGKRIGSHTYDHYAECLTAMGIAYNLPFEDVGGSGPIWTQTTDEDFYAGSMTIGAAFMPTEIGRIPCLIFRFTGRMGDQDGIQSPGIYLMMEPPGLKSIRQNVSAAVDRAILAARRGH